jgi:hypothetical protein
MPKTSFLNLNSGVIFFIDKDSRLEKKKKKKEKKILLISAKIEKT